jgi:putative ABC transport system permease protein
VIAVTLAPGADAGAVARDIERQYPSLDVRTDDEQVRATIGDQAPLLASAVALVGLAVGGGVVLVLNVLALLVHQQRGQLAALRASGVPTRTLVGVVTLQGALLGLAGGLLGVAVAVPTAALLDHGIELVTGYSGLVRTPVWLLAGGLALALVMGVLGAAAAGWRVARLDPLEQLVP